MGIDIKEIVEMKISENNQLEYKEYTFSDGKFNSLSNDNKETLAKEISAFANAEGGYIVLGVIEDENNSPLDLVDTGVYDDIFQTWKHSFEQYISIKTRPNLEGLSCHLIQIQDKNMILIEVPKSNKRPHAFNNKDKDEYIIRRSADAIYMNLNELQFAPQENNQLDLKETSSSNKDQKTFSELNLKNTDINYKKFKRIEFSDSSLGNAQIQDSCFSECTFENIGLKNAKISDTKVNQSTVNNCYLRHATLNKCDFTGTKFTNSNLEKTKFTDNTFHYAQFDNCLLNIDSLIDNAPKYVNLKLFFFEQLYKNESNLGNSKTADKLLYLVLNTEGEIHKEIFKNKEEYYQAQNNSVLKRGKHFLLWLSSQAMKYLFGYGLKITTVFISFLAIIFLFALIHLIMLDIGFFTALEISTQNVLLSNISTLNSEHLSVFSRSINYLQNFTGIIYLAVLTSSFYRKVAR